MKKIGFLVLLFSLVVSFSMTSFASGDHDGGHGHKVVGAIEKTEGAFVTVKDEHGKMHKFHVNKSTHLKGKIKAGVQVEVEHTDGGHAISMVAVKK